MKEEEKKKETLLKCLTKLFLKYLKMRKKEYVKKEVKVEENVAKNEIFRKQRR